MGITHYSIHTGKTKAIRAQASAPTDPSPETGDIWFDSTDGAQSIVVYSVNAWLFTGMQKA